MFRNLRVNIVNNRVISQQDGSTPGIFKQFAVDPGAQYILTLVEYFVNDTNTILWIADKKMNIIYLGEIKQIIALMTNTTHTTIYIGVSFNRPRVGDTFYIKDITLIPTHLDNDTQMTNINYGTYDNLLVDIPMRFQINRQQLAPYTSQRPNSVDIKPYKEFKTNAIKIEDGIKQELILEDTYEREPAFGQNAIENVPPKIKLADDFYEGIVKEINGITKRITTYHQRGQYIKHYSEVSQMREQRKALLSKCMGNLPNGVQCFLIPFVVPDCYISSSVALIGNSGKLRRANYGPEIDRHTDVVRFKYAMTSGFEDIVGSKETIRVAFDIQIEGIKFPTHTNNIVANYKNLHDLHNQKIIFLGKNELCTNYMNIADLIRRMNAFRFDRTNIIYSTLWAPQVFRDISGHTLAKMPQIGLGMLLYIVDLGVCPDVYGYDTEVSKDNLGYYWTNVLKEEWSPYHNYQLEHKILKELHANGRIVLH